MAIEVETKDCTALSDAELAELADMCAGGPAGYEIGLHFHPDDDEQLTVLLEPFSGRRAQQAAARRSLC